MHIEHPDLQVVLITGMSGSGKSVALHALEDAGFFCVDNLPPELLLPFVTLERQHNASRVAIAMDARNANALPLLPAQLALLKDQGIKVKSLFLDATPTPWFDAIPRRGASTPCRKPSPTHRTPACAAPWSMQLKPNANC